MENSICEKKPDCDGREEMDYKAMYFKLYNTCSDLAEIHELAASILRRAQNECERYYTEAWQFPGDPRESEE